MKRTALLLGYYCVFFGALLFGQGPVTGTPPFASLQSGGFDTINRQNLNAMFQIPILSTPGRGLNFSAALSYNSLFWQKTSANTWASAVDSNGSPTWGWGGDKNPIGTPEYRARTFRCVAVDHDFSNQWKVVYDGYAFRDPSGTFHSFNIQFERDQTEELYPECNNNEPQTGYATDGSGYYLDATNPTSPKVFAPAGMNIEFQGPMQDTNGNYISQSPNGAETDWIDSLGRTALKVITNSSSTDYKFRKNGGTWDAPITVTLNYTPYHIKTQFLCSNGVQDYDSQTNIPLPTSLVTPDGTYTFTYEATPGYSGDVTGRIAIVALPGGGSYEYSYGSINCDDGTLLGLTRTIHSGGTTAVWGFLREAQAGSNWKTTVTAPTYPGASGNVTNHTVHIFNATGQETSQSIYEDAASGTPLRAVSTSYLGVFPSIVTTQLDNGLQQTTEYSYDNYGNLYSTLEHDWGAGTAGTVLRSTKYEYLTANDYLNQNIVDRATRVTVYNGGFGGTVMSRTDTSYDESSYVNDTCRTGATHHNDVYGCTYTVRGNPTSVTTYSDAATPAGGLTSHYKYDSVGNVTAVVDPNGSSTTIHYEDSWVPDSSCTGDFGTAQTFAYPTSGTNVLNQTSSSVYNSCTGMVQSATDINGKPTQYAYDPASTSRIQQVTPPSSGAATTYAYNFTSAPFSVTATSHNTNGDVVSKTLVDPLGRVSQKQLTSDPDAGTSLTDYQDITYDIMGRISTVSNPHRDTSASTDGITSTKYDALGRTTQIVHPDSSSAAITYLGASRLVQDEGNGNSPVKRVSQVDALGRVVKVCEITSVTLQSDSPAPCGLGFSTDTGFLTSYTYDVLNNLKTVSQGNRTQRSFSYDSLSRQTGETTPEAGATNYDYNAAGDLYHRTRPKPNQASSTSYLVTTYTYDLLHRLTGRSYDDGVTASNTFAYDEVSQANPKGRLTSETAVSGSTTIAKSVFDYDELGRIIGNSQCTRQNCTGTLFALTYGYDKLGNVTSFSNGAGVAFAPTFNTASRLTGLTRTPYDAQHPQTLLSNVAYNAFGVPQSATFGNGVTETHTADSLGRVTSQVDSGLQATAATLATGYLDVTGAERQTGAPGTGNVSFGGSLQSTQVLNQAAVSGSGNVSMSGTLQTTQVGGQAGVSGTGSATITGGERSHRICDYMPPDYDTWGCWTDRDFGHISITVNGQTWTENYADGDTMYSVASRLAGDIASSSYVNVSLSSNVITLAAKTTGTATNYSISQVSASDDPYFGSGSSFNATMSGASMTGGQNAVAPTTVYDAGTVSATASGFTKSVSYGQGSTPSTVAASLSAAFNGDGSSPVNASASGVVLYLTSKATGAATNYSLTAVSSTSQTQYFAQPSFVATRSGAAFTGGADATYNTVYDAGTASITVNGHENSVSYGLGGNATPAAIASALATNINGDSGASVTATAPSSTVYLTAKTVGVSTNYSLSSSVTTTQGTYFAQPSFTKTNSGSALTGGMDASGGQSISDTGTIYATVNGTTSQTGYGSSSTPSTLASALASAINTNNSSVTAAVSGSRVNITSTTTGANANYSLAATPASATNSSSFTGTSFTVNPSGSALQGGQNASTSPATIYSYTAAFKPNGSVSTSTDSVNGNWSYGYDDFNRLASANKTAGPQLVYGYDRYGNRVSQTGGSNFGFDANNRISQTCGTGGSFTYDAVGNMTYDCNHYYTFDAENRIVAVDTTGATYDYDAEGKRIRSVVGSSTLNFIYDLSGRVAAVEDGTGTLVRGEIFAGGAHLGTYNSTTTYFAHSDWLGSERVRSDVNAMVANSSTSLPFGDGLSSSGVSPMQFAGMEHGSNAEGGLENTLFRKYSAIQGRWLSPDPYSGSMNLGNPQSLNRYAYVGNDPVNWLDPDGLNRTETFSFGDCVTTLTYEYIFHSNGSGDGGGTFREEQTGGSVVCSGGGGGPQTPSFIDSAIDSVSSFFSTAIYANRCAARNANSIKSLVGLGDNKNLLVDAFLGNDIASVSNLALGQPSDQMARPTALLGLEITGPQKVGVATLLSDSLAATKTGNLVGYAHPFLQSNGKLIEMAARAEVVGDKLAFKAIAGPLNVLQAVKGVYDAGAYFGALIACSEGTAH